MLVGKTDHRPSKRVSISNDGGRTARSHVFRQAALTGSCAGDHFGSLRQLAVKALVDDPFGFRNKFLCFTFLQIAGAIGQGTF